MQVVQQVLELGPFSDPPQLNVGEDFLWNKNIQIDKLCKIIVHEGRLGLSTEMSKCMVQIFSYGEFGDMYEYRNKS